MLDLQNSANWFNTYNTTLNVTPIPGLNRYTPIGDFSIPVLLYANIIAVYLGGTGTAYAFGGYAKQRISTGLTVGSTADSETFRQKLYNNQINVLFLPTVGTNYTLDVYVSWRFRSANLTVWQYTGPT